MKKNIVLYILLAFLVLVNGFFIVKHLKEPGKKKRSSPRNFITKQLDFNPDQMEQFKTLEKAHRQRMKVIYDDTKILKDALFSKVHDASVQEKEIDSLTSLLGLKEKEKDAEVFNYFRSISKFCDDSQKEQLSKLLKKARHRSKGRNHGPPRRKR